MSVRSPMRTKNSPALDKGNWYFFARQKPQLNKLLVPIKIQCFSPTDAERSLSVAAVSISIGYGSIRTGED